MCNESIFTVAYSLRSVFSTEAMNTALYSRLSPMKQILIISRALKCVLSHKNKLMLLKIFLSAMLGSSGITKSNKY